MNPAPDVRRGPLAAAQILAFAVLLGVVCLGAPPRFSAGTSGPGWLREFFSSLAPLCAVEAAIAVALGVLIAFECARRESPGLPGGDAARRARMPLLLLFILGLVQLVPLPRGVLSAVAPFSAETYASLAASGDDTMRTISLWPAGTAHALFNLAGVIAATSAVWGLVRGGSARHAAVLVLLFVLAVAFAESADGLVATRVGDDRLLGTFEKVSGRGRVTGTFIHGTMMAVWAGMGACAALGLAAAWTGTERRRLVLPAILAAAVCVLVGLLTLSRLGWLGVAVGGTTTCVLVGVALSREGRRGAGRAVIAGSLALVALAVFAAFAVPAFRERIDYLFTGTASEEPRFAIWRSAADLFERAPVLGTGLGSFGRAIHLTQSADSPQELWFAHSDPLNLLCDTGVVGAALGLWWILAMFRAGLPALRSPDFATRCLAAGAFGAAVTVLVASLGDFQTQFPVVAIPFAALFTVPAALAAASVAEGETDIPRAGLLPARLLAGGMIVVAAGVALVPLVSAGERWREVHGGGVTGPTRAESLLARAKTILVSVKTAADPKSELARAETMLREASRLDPLLDEAHLWTGLAALSLGRSRDDVLRALGRARIAARGHAQTNLAVGRTYLDLLGTDPAPYGPEGDTAIAALREAGEIEPKAFTAAWDACVARDLPLSVLREITPDRSYAKCFLFDHLRSIGRHDEALALLEDQLERDPKDENAARRLAAAYVEMGRSSEGRSFFDRVGAVWPE